MSGFTIDISGNADKQLSEIADKVKNIIQDELTEFGNATVISAIGYAPVDEGFLRTHIKSEVFPDKLSVDIIVACDYAAYLEFGTRSFAAAYVSTLPATWQEYAATFKGKGGGGMEEFVNNLVEWVRRKGIAGVYSVKTHNRVLGKAQQETDDYAAAYAIALSIIRKGIRPHPFLFPAIEENLIKLKQNLSTI